MVNSLPPMRETRVGSLNREDPLEKAMGTHSSGQRSLVGYSAWGRKGSDTTEWLTSISPPHASLSPGGSRVSGYSMVVRGDCWGRFSTPSEGFSSLPLRPPVKQQTFLNFCQNFNKFAIFDGSSQPPTPPVSLGCFYKVDISNKLMGNCRYYILHILNVFICCLL